MYEFLQRIRWDLGDSKTNSSGHPVIRSSVARWFIFKPKIPIFVNFGGLAIEDVGIFYVRWVHFPAIWHILWPFVHFPPFWFIFTRLGTFHFPPFWYILPRFGMFG
jgi:hypothetical protein